MTLPSERERARRLATNVVSLAIGIAGVTLVFFSIFLVLRGGAPLIFLAILIGGLGAVLAILGFFFQLVPFRLQELADEKRDFDQRVKEGKAEPYFKR